MNGYQHIMNKIGVTKQTVYVEIRKPPNLCSAIRSLFYFHHARFYCFVTPSFFILLSEPHTAHGSCRNRPFDNKLLEFQEQSRQTVPSRQPAS